MPLSVGLLAAAQKASTSRPQPEMIDPTSSDSWRGRAQYRQQLDVRLGPRTHFAIDPSVIAPSSVSDAPSSKSSKGKHHALNAPWAAQPTESRSGSSASPPEAVHAHGQPVFSPALPNPTKSSGATVSVQSLHNPADWEYDSSFASWGCHNNLRPGLGAWSTPRARMQYTSSYPGRGRRPETKPLPYLFVMTYVRPRPRPRTRHASTSDRPPTAYGSSTVSESDNGYEEETPNTPPANAPAQPFGGAAKRRRTDGLEGPYSISSSTVPSWTRDSIYTTAA